MAVSEPMQALLGLAIGLALVGVTLPVVWLLVRRSQRRLDKINAEERAKCDRWALEHELNMLPCSNPNCSQCVYGMSYVPSIPTKWVWR